MEIMGDGRTDGQRTNKFNKRRKEVRKGRKEGWKAPWPVWPFVTLIEPAK